MGLGECCRETHEEARRRERLRQIVNRNLGSLLTLERLAKGVSSFPKRDHSSVDCPGSRKEPVDLAFVDPMYDGNTCVSQSFRVGITFIFKRIELCRQDICRWKIVKAISQKRRGEWVLAILW